MQTKNQVRSTWFFKLDNVQKSSADQQDISIYNVELILPCSHSFFFSNSFFDLGVPFSFCLTNSSIPFDLSCPRHTQSFQVTLENRRGKLVTFYYTIWSSVILIYLVLIYKLHIMFIFLMLISTYQRWAIQKQFFFL